MGVTRRQFVQQTAGVAAAAALAPKLAWAEEPFHFGVQLFMLKKYAEADLPSTLRTIRTAGFRQVELYPVVYNRPAKQLRQQIADSGMECVSGHFDYDTLEQKVDYAHELGLKYMVCPMLPKAQWTSLDGFRKAAEVFSRTGELARKAGLEFAYHNHSYDFRPMEGSYGFAEIMKNSDARLVKLEFDLFWLTQAGRDPLQMLHEYRDRAVLVHVKGRRPGAPTGFTMESGETSEVLLSQGSVNYGPLLKQARGQGIHYAYLDHDSIIVSPEEDLNDAYDYLQGLGV